MIKIVQLDPNGLCNSKCWFCPVAYVPNPDIGRVNMPIETVEKILKQLRDGVGDFVSPDMQYIYPAHYNEVLLYPQFKEFLDLYRKYGFKILVFSNGVNLTPEKTDLLNEYKDVVGRITLNIPSAFKDQWHTYTGMNIKLFDKLINNLKYLNDNMDFLTSKRLVSIQVNGVKEKSLIENGGLVKLLENAPEINLDNDSGDVQKTIDKFKKMFNNINVFEDTDLLDRSGHLVKFNVMKNSYSAENNLKEGKKIIGCSEKRAEEWLHISAAGDVFLCCNDYDFETIYGNIKNNTIKDIWNGIERSKMISKSFNDFCTKCSCAIWQ